MSHADAVNLPGMDAAADLTLGEPVVAIETVLEIMLACSGVDLAGFSEMLEDIRAMAERSGLGGDNVRAEKVYAHAAHLVDVARRYLAGVGVLNAPPAGQA